MPEPVAKATTPVIDAQRYRQVLAQYPTGVCVITGRGSDGEPLAMVVGSFTSVSLAPPLVAFFPDRKSNTWAKLRGCDSFCVNILAADQEPVCRRLALKEADKFTGTAHRLSRRGNPIVDGVVGWIDCARHSVTDAGDHEMVLGLVLELDVIAAGRPLLFLQGGYGRYTPAAIAGGPDDGMTPAAMEAIMDIDRRLRRLEDRAAIDELVVDYFIAADGDDLAGIGASFTDDAVFRASGAVTATGRRGIIDFIKSARERMGLTVHTPHYARVRFTGDDEADGLVGAHLELVVGGKSLFGAVRYVDHYVRQHGVWLIATRDMRAVYIAEWSTVGEVFASDLPIRWTGAPPAPSDYPRRGF